MTSASVVESLGTGTDTLHVTEAVYNREELWWKQFVF